MSSSTQLLRFFYCGFKVARRHKRGKMTIPSTVSGRPIPTPSDIDFARAIEWLHLALEAGKSVGWDWDVKSGRDSWFGDLETMFGIPSKTYIGHVEDFRRRVYPDDRAIVWKAVQDAM